MEGGRHGGNEGGKRKKRWKEAEAEACEYLADQKVIHRVGIGSDTPANKDINQGWEGHSFSGSPALCARGPSLISP